MLTLKIVVPAEASVLYIYIYIDQLITRTMCRILSFITKDKLQAGPAQRIWGPYVKILNGAFYYPGLLNTLTIFYHISPHSVIFEYNVQQKNVQSPYLQESLDHHLLLDHFLLTNLLILYQQFSIDLDQKYLQEYNQVDH